jgi:hypothetical protein
MTDNATRDYKLHWNVFVTPGVPIKTLDLPPDIHRRMWSPTSATLIYGERDAIILCSFAARLFSYHPSHFLPIGSLPTFAATPAFHQDPIDPWAPRSRRARRDDPPVRTNCSQHIPGHLLIGFAPLGTAALPITLGLHTP